MPHSCFNFNEDQLEIKATDKTQEGFHEIFMLIRVANKPTSEAR